MDKLPIAPRQEGETEEDFQRRYGREKQAIYRARRPKNDRKRGKGKGPAKNGDLTREEWEALQPQPGEAADDHKRRYAREMVRRYRARHKERLAVERRTAYAADPEPDRERQRRMRREHPDRQKGYDRRYDERNPGKRAAAAKRWAEENPDKRYAVARNWRLANLDRCASYASKRRAAELSAIPPWADMLAIQAFYEEARRLSDETGVPYHVDHIVPLQGKGVCGLHVETNLRVIPGPENVRKRAKVDYALIYSLYDCNPKGHRNGQTSRPSTRWRLGSDARHRTRRAA